MTLQNPVWRQWPYVGHIPGTTPGQVLEVGPDLHLRPLAGLTGGHWEPVIGGDPDEPQPVYVMNVLGDWDMLIIWVED